MSEQPTDPAGGVPLPGARERTEFQLAGEALLSNDGRITAAPQAKTVAIQAMAARMRSSTPELVLASMGLVVGGEMAAHLGDVAMCWSRTTSTPLWAPTCCTSTSSTRPTPATHSDGHASRNVRLCSPSWG